MRHSWKNVAVLGMAALASLAMALPSAQEPLNGQDLSAREELASLASRASKKPMVIDLDLDLPASDIAATVDESLKSSPHRREVTDGVDIVITKLTNMFNRAIIHWSGSNSTVMFALTLRVFGSTVNSYDLFRSSDYGKTWESQKAKFGTSSMLDGYHISPHDLGHLVFTDMKFHTIWVTKDEGITYQKQQLGFAPAYIGFNDDIEGIMFAVDGDRKVYVSTNTGSSWTGAAKNGASTCLLASGNLYWGNAEVEQDTMFMECNSQKYSETDTNSRIARVSNLKKFTSADRSALALTDVTPTGRRVYYGSFYLSDQYTFFAAPAGSSKQLMVSTDRVTYAVADFSGPDTELDYMILDTSEDQVFVAVDHKNKANIYISEEDGLTYTLSLENALYNDSIVDFEVVEGLQGIYLATQWDSDQQMHTVITFDKGGEWEPLQPPADSKSPIPPQGPCQLPECGMHLQLSYGSNLAGVYYNLLYSTPSAPGFLLANGNVGSYLASLMNGFMSRDAGVTWNQVLDGEQQFVSLDHGGVLVACDPYLPRSSGSQYISFSFDEGETWKQVQVSDTPLHFVRMLTEPGETSIRATIWGYPANTGTVQWTIVHLDFTPGLGSGRKCGDDDYTTWVARDPANPDSIGCLLGVSETFERRKASARCVNGRDYDRPVEETTCPCSTEDYECDVGYERLEDSGMCVPVDAELVLPKCTYPGEKITLTRGYRKIQDDGCEGGIAAHVEPTTYTCQDPCPMSAWSEWTPCNVCSDKLSYRTREPSDPHQDTSLCPCTQDSRACDAEGLDADVVVLPGSLHLRPQDPVVLAAQIDHSTVMCPGGVQVSPSIKYSWSISPSNTAALSTTAFNRNASVLDGFSFVQPGFYTITLNVKVGTTNKQVSASVVVYSGETYLQLSYSTSSARDTVSSIADAIKDHAIERIAEVTQTRNDMFDQVELSFDDSSGAIVISFRLVGTDPNFEKLVSQFMQATETALMGGKLDMTLFYVSLAAQQGTFHEIAPPDDVFTTAEPSTKHGKVATAVLAPLVVVCLVLVVALFLYARNLVRARRVASYQPVPNATQNPVHVGTTVQRSEEPDEDGEDDEQMLE
eukprot:m.353816 g.353816  ORF g.353816 m.353816 type:complete len:1092 (+) comp16839_c0_seq1:256-3531(+)